MITLGKFEEGQTVRPANKHAYASDRIGTVVQVTPTKIRVLWGKQANGVAAKRTWVNRKSLVQVVAAEPQPAVGPGGWLLDTRG